MTATDARYTKNTHMIDMQIEHPTYGLIPFTAYKDDVDYLSRELYQRAINGEFGDIQPYTQPQVDNKVIILQQIKDLEAQQTLRLLREASLGVEFALNKLKDIDAQIATLRQELSTIS